MGSAFCLPRSTRRKATGKTSKSSETPVVREKQDGTKGENSTLGAKRRGFSPQQDPPLELCTYANSPKTHVRKMKHTATGTETSVTVELSQMSSRDATSNSATVLREEFRNPSDVETGGGRTNRTAMLHYLFCLRYTMSTVELIKLLPTRTHQICFFLSEVYICSAISTQYYRPG